MQSHIYGRNRHGEGARNLPLGELLRAVQPPDLLEGGRQIPHCPAALLPPHGLQPRRPGGLVPRGWPLTLLRAPTTVSPPIVPLCRGTLLRILVSGNTFPPAPLIGKVPRRTKPSTRSASG